MKPRIAAFALLLCAFASSAFAFGGRYYYYPQNYCNTGYCAPTHSYPVTYGEWAYWIYPTGTQTATPYYYRVRVKYENGCRSIDNDGYLYTYVNGCYHKHCLITEFHSKAAIALVPTGELKQLGQTVYGNDPLAYLVAKTYGKEYATQLQQQGVPSPVDVAGLLPPLATQRVAIIESATKQARSGGDLLASVLVAEQNTELANIQTRGKLAMQVAALQSTERIFGKVAEIQAIAAQQATISATAFTEQIPIQDQNLRQIVATSCFACHGAADAKGGVDFKQAGTWSAKEWKRVWLAAETGRMPKGGQPLDETSVAYFETQYERAKSANGSVPPSAPPGF